MFAGLYKDSLCASCEGCNRQDNDNFHGLFSCTDYIRSALVKDNTSKTYNSKSYAAYSYPTRTTPKREKKTYTIEINDLSEGKKFLSNLQSKQYFLNYCDGDIEGNEELIAIFYCYDDRSTDYCNCYEIKTVDRQLKDELMNLYRGI